MYINPNNVSYVNVTGIYENITYYDIFLQAGNCISTSSNSSCVFDDEFNGSIIEFLEKYKITVNNHISLEERRKELLNIVNTEHNSTKKVQVLNGNSFELSNEDNAWNYFCKIIEVACQQTTEVTNTTPQQYTANSYISQNLFVIKENENAKYTVKLQNFFWKKIFGEFHENRVKNVEIKQTVEAKIKKATTIEELDAITFEFLGKNGITIDVNQKVEELKLEAQQGLLPQEAIDALYGEFDEQGNVHIIEKEDF